MLKNKNEEKIRIKKEFGQNFLNNEIFCEKISSYLTTDKNSKILEIGPGAGALTRFILNLPHKEVIAIEYDIEWAKFVEKKFADKKIKIINLNILDYSLENEPENIHLIGNIPYYITCPILEWVIKNKDKINETVLMMQEEVAQKIYKSNGKDYGPLSVILQIYFEIELLLFIEAKYFTPAPKVNSRVVRLKNNLKSQDIKIDIKNFRKFLSIIFKHPRKTIENNIRGTHLEKNENFKLFLNIFKNSRAQEFSPFSLLAIFKIINNKDFILTKDAIDNWQKISINKPYVF